MSVVSAKSITAKIHERKMLGMSMVYLVADIGGTNTRVALAQGSELLTETIQKFPNADAPHLRDIFSSYIATRGDISISAACIAVAGPVHNGVAQMTNLDWLIQDHDISASLGIDKVGVINDLQAQGYALPYIDDADLSCLKQGKTPDFHATRLVIGIGTGFNAAPAYVVGDTTLVPPAEAGHVRLPASNDQERAIADQVAGNNGFASVEHILSGRGVERLERYFDPTSTRSAADVLAAAQNGDAIAQQVVTQFARFAGSVAGDLALTVLPFGGIYLIGGVARAMSPYMDDSNFNAAFVDKDRFAEFNAQFPVHVVHDDFAALRGCSGYAEGL